MANIATAEVRVVADTSRFIANLRRQLRGAFAGLGSNLGRDLGRDIADSATREIQTGLNRGFSRIRMQLPAAVERRMTDLFRRPIIQAGLNASSDLALGLVGNEREVRAAAERIGRSLSQMRLAQNLIDRGMLRSELGRVIVDFGNTGFTAADTFNRRFGQRLRRGLRTVGSTITTGLRTGMTAAGNTAADVLTGTLQQRLRQQGQRIATGLGLALRSGMQTAATNAGNVFSQRLGQVLGNQARTVGNRFLTGLFSFFRRSDRGFTGAGRRGGARFGAALLSGALVGIRALGRALSSISLGPLLALAGAIRNMTSEMVDQIGIFIAMVGLIESLSGLLFALPAALNVAALGIATLVVAFRGFGSAISASFDDLAAFEDAIDDLAPAAQAAAREFRAIAPALSALRLDVQEAMFRRLEGTITAVADNLLGPMRDGMVLAGEALGNLVAEVGAFFAQSATADTTLAVFETVAALFDAMAASARPFLEGMRNLVDAFLPRLAGLAEPLSQLGERFREWTATMIESGRAAELFDHAVVTFRNLIGIVVELGRVFRGIFDAAATAGVDALGGLVLGIHEIANAFQSLEGQNALVDIFQSLQVIIPIVAQFMGALLVEFGALTPIMAQIAQAVGPSLIIVIQALGDALQSMGPGVVAVFNGIAQAAEAIAPALVPIGRALGSVLSAIAPILPVIGQLIGIVVELGAQIISVLASAITPIVEALAGALAPVLPMIADLFSRLITAVAPLIEVLGAGLASVIQTLLPPIINLALALADALMPVIEALVPVLTPLLEIFFQLVEVVGSLLVPVVSLLLPIIAALSPLFELLSVVITPLLELLVAILTPITTLITLLADLLTPIIEFLATVITAIINAALAPLTFAFDALAAVLRNYVIPWFQSSTAMLQLFWNAAIVPLINWIRNLTSVVSERFGTIRSAVQTLRSAWQTGINAMMTWVQNFWDRITAAFAVIGTVLSGFQSTWDSIWANVTSVISTAWNSIKGIIDSISSAISTVSSGISSLGDLWPFANGGIVTRATPALVGEAGAEVIIPLTRPARAQQLAEQSGLIDMLTSRGALGSASEAESGPPMQLHVHSAVADAEQVARRAARIMERHMSGRGLERIPS